MDVSKQYKDVQSESIYNLESGQVFSDDRLQNMTLRNENLIEQSIST